MIVGIGTDLFRYSRLAPEPLEPNDPFFRRAFTSAEQLQASERSTRFEYLAARFSAKEAIYKAISICGEEFHPGDIEIIDDEDGQPHARLSGKTKRRFERFIASSYSIHISLSHEDDHVLAFALVHTQEGA